MKATVYDLDNGIGVCLLEDGVNIWVGEVRFNPLRVMPQTVKEVVGVTTEEVVVEDEATTQDRIDQATMGLARFRTRLDEFDTEWTDDADMREWAKEAIAARDTLVALIGKLRAEKGVAW